MKKEGLIQGNNYFPYNPNLKQRARELRTNATKGEILLWIHLLRKKQTGYTFYRQRTIEHYIVDFYCAALKLVIEVDGSSHENKLEYDTNRSRDLEYWGIKVFRITEHEVVYHMPQVKQKVMEVINQRRQELEQSNI